jgi:predicted transcriptional regulator
MPRHVHRLSTRDLAVYRAVVGLRAAVAMPDLARSLGQAEEDVRAVLSRLGQRGMIVHPGLGDRVGPVVERGG